MKRLRTLALASMLFFAAAHARAQNTSAPDSTAIRRVVVLDDGSVVRGPAIETEAGFTIGSGERARKIERAHVSSARVEREVLAELREKKASIPPLKLGERAESCRWMLAQGLDEEALAELDFVLWKRPDDPRVLRIVGEAPARVSTAVVDAKSSRADVLRAGAREKGARRELVVRRLAFDLDRATLPDALVSELGSTVTARREFACLALRRLFAGQELGSLAVRAVLDPATLVRDGAILALRDARDPVACAAVVNALCNPSARVRVNAVEALGRMGYRESIDPLVRLMVAAVPASGGGGYAPARANLYVGLQTAYVRDFNVEIAQGSSIADPIIGQLSSGVVFDVGIAGISSQPVQISDEMWAGALALTQLTGQRFGADAPAWKKWWDENRHRFVPGATAPPTTKNG